MNPSPEFFEQRRATMLNILAMRQRGETVNRRPLPPLCISMPIKAAQVRNMPPDRSKPPAVRLETMLRKAEQLLEGMPAQPTETAFAYRRQQYYTLKNEIKRHCARFALPMPELPLAPVSPWPGARPRLRASR